MSYTLSPSQLETLVFEVALAAGLDTQGYASLEDVPPSERSDLINSLELDIAARELERISDQLGLFTPLYGTLNDWLSIDDGSGNPGDDPKEGVDASAWTFIRAAANVNLGNSLDAFMTRGYTKAQYELRIGETPSDALINKMSNGIAFNIVRNIILDHGVIPDIHDLGEGDARVVVDVYFDEDPGGWAGNAFFHYFGDGGFFDDVLDPSRANGHGTYDILASMYAMQKTLLDEFAPNLLYLWFTGDALNPAGRSFVIENNALGTDGTQDLFDQLQGTLSDWLSDNYYEPEGIDFSNLFKTFYDPSPLDNPRVTRPRIYMGKLHEDNDNIDLSGEELTAAVIVRGGDHDDHVYFSNFDGGFVDGGEGYDTLDLWSMASPVEITSGPARSLNQAIYIADHFFTDNIFACNFEELKLTVYDDKVRVFESHVPDLEKLDTGGGDDEVSSALAHSEGSGWRGSVPGFWSR